MQLELNGRLGKTYLEHEDPIRALQYFEAQLVLVQQIGDTPREGRIKSQKETLREKRRWSNASILGLPRHMSVNGIASKPLRRRAIQSGSTYITFTTRRQAGELLSRSNAGD